MDKTALITGATGLLGREIFQAFKATGWKTVGTGFSRASPPTILKVDLLDATAIKSAIDEVKPDVVIHSAANRFPDKVEADPDGAKKTNVGATKHLAEAAEKQGALVIYISTDYVFPGKVGEAPYESDAQPNPTNLYGQTKLDGEKATLDATRTSSSGVVLRVPVLYGKATNPKESAVNVLMDAVWKAQDADAGVKMDDWAQRYPTNTEDVARVTVDIAKKYLDAGDARGQMPKVLQFSSEDRMTKYRICEVFAEIMGLSLDGMNADKAGNDPNAAVQRPFDTHLSTKALKELGIDVGTQNFEAWWRWQVKAYRK